MSTKLLLASSLCLLLVSWTSPAFNQSNVALSATLDKSGAPQGMAANTPNSDSFVSDQVRQAFINDSELATDVNNISIDTKDGVVTLTGTVANDASKTAFAQKAANVPGVKAVNNQIEIQK